MSLVRSTPSDARSIMSALDDEATRTADGWGVDRDLAARGALVSAWASLGAPSDPGAVKLATSRSGTGVDHILLSTSALVTYYTLSSLDGVECDGITFNVDQEGEGAGDSQAAVVIYIYGLLKGGAGKKCLPGVPVSFPQGFVLHPNLYVTFEFPGQTGTSKARITWDCNHTGAATATGDKAARRRMKAVTMGADIGAAQVRRASAMKEAMGAVVTEHIGKLQRAAQVGAQSLGQLASGFPGMGGLGGGGFPGLGGGSLGLGSRRR